MSLKFNLSLMSSHSVVLQKHKYSNPSLTRVSYCTVHVHMVLHQSAVWNWLHSYAFCVVMCILTCCILAPSLPPTVSFEHLSLLHLCDCAVILFKSCDQWKKWCNYSCGELYLLYSPMDLPRARVLKKTIAVGEGILYIVGHVTIDRWCHWM